MIEIRRILCPVDFSVYSRLALNHAVAMARWYHAEVTVLHVVPQVDTTDALGFVPVVMSDADRATVTAELHRLASAASTPELTVMPAVRTGLPVPEILKQADEMRADLLVLGSHGRSGFERLLLGSVTERVLRKAPCPTLVVPDRPAEGWSAAPRVLCPVDFSDSSLRAVEYALSVAEEAAEAHVLLLHVVEREADETGAYPDVLVALDSGVGIEELRRQHEDALQRRLTQLVPSNMAGVCTIDATVTHGKPWREILRLSEQHRSDLIVMGVQGRGSLDLVIFGSTTQHVIRQADCPVLTIRS